MLRTLISMSSILSGLALLLVGVGLLGTLLGIRAGIEGFSESVTGVVMACYFGGYLIGTEAAPALIGRIGHIRTFAALAATASAAALLHGLALNPWAWAVLRVVTGACLVGLYMVIESWLSALSDNRNRGRVFATYMTVSLLALAVGQLLLLVADVRSLVPFALVSVLVSLGLVPVALTRVHEPAPVETAQLQLHFLYRTSPLGVAGVAAAGLVLGAFWGLSPLFAHNVGLSTPAVALYMGATILGGAFLQWPIGHLSDHHDRRAILMIVCFTGAILAIAMAVGAHQSHALLYASAFLFGGAAFTVYSLSVAHVQDHLESEEALLATRGLLLVYGLGAVAGPALSGALMDRLGVLSLPVYFCAVLTLLGAFTAMRMRIAAPPPMETRGDFAPMVRTSQAVLEMHPGTEPMPEGE